MDGNGFSSLSHAKGWTQGQHQPLHTHSDPSPLPGTQALLVQPQTRLSQALGVSPVDVGVSPVDVGASPVDVGASPTDVGAHVLASAGSLPSSCFVLGDERGQLGSDPLIFH